jgi:hypothetical protein
MAEKEVPYEGKFGGFDRLMPYRVREVLLVASAYDAFLLAEDDKLTELVFTEYLGLNLRYAPRVTRVSTAEEALEMIRQEPFESESYDLIITMTHVGNMDFAAFTESAKRINPEIPVFLLAHNLMDVQRLTLRDRASLDRIFLWTGHARILLSIIKQIEDNRNIDHDIEQADVQTILLVEDSVRFYSHFLPLVYTELLEQTRRLMSDSLNLTHKMLRMRARPKILLATTFDEAWELYQRYRKNLLGIITDIQFPRAQKIDPEAGLRLIEKIKTETPDIPMLLQSSDKRWRENAEKLGASFLHKAAPTLLEDLRAFILEHMGFADFQFHLPDGKIVGTAQDLRGLLEQLRTVPDESILYHAKGNHFSKWLMARTEFELAHRIRVKRIAHFNGTAELRSFLINTIDAFVKTSQAGVVAEFSERHFTEGSQFVKISSGSLGGKGRGLAFLNSLLSQQPLLLDQPDVRVGLPNTAVIATQAFDDFLEHNDLRPFLQERPEDDAIRQRFLESDLPQDVVTDLQAFLEKVRRPLAVRSSSLLEDSQAAPFAGVYDTFMLPNSHSDANYRLNQLLRAIKLIYASTFFGEARAYLRNTPHLLEDEKMAIVVQHLVGRGHGERFYPDLSGVAQSYNYYPVGPMTHEEGIVSLTLGLGQAVVEGYRTLDVCPAHPQAVYQLASVKMALTHTQTEFLGLDMMQKDFLPSRDTRENIAPFPLDAANEDGILGPLGSTYVAANDRIYEGTGRAGVRLVSMHGALSGDALPLPTILKAVLKAGEEAVGCPVEIEFAATLEPPEFHILQIRPMFSWSIGHAVRLEDAEREAAWLYSPLALGHGQLGGICDIIYVKPHNLDPAVTHAIAKEIGTLNKKLVEEKRRYVLIGPGRWGSADPSLGIPVAWSQISASRLIVETSPEEQAIEPSHGTHFLHNVVSAGIGYLTIGSNGDGGRIDWEWLNTQASVEETDHLRHVRVRKPLDVRIDGKAGEGAVLKPE